MSGFCSSSVKRGALARDAFRSNALIFEVLSRYQLFVVVAAFLALAALYSLVTPLGEGPDEPGHAAYVFFLAREGRLPLQRAAPLLSDVPGEGHQPPLAYALAAPLVAWLPREERRFDLPGNPRFTWAGGAELNAVAHGSREYPPWRGAVLAWRMARFASVVAGAATVLFTYLAARAVGRRLQIADQGSSFALVAAALAAFNPQFLFVSSLITNDALLTALSAALLWLTLSDDGWLSLAERRVSGGGGGVGAGRLSSLFGGQWQAAAIGVVLGLALLTKQSALILAPITLFWCLTPRFPGFGARLIRCLLAFGMALALSGWWYARNWLLYGDPLGIAAFRAEFATQPFAFADPAAWAAALSQLHSSFWARFGWMNAAPPPWVIWLFAAIEVAAVAGLLQRMFATGQRSTIALLRALWPVAALPLLAFVWLVGFALTAGLVAWQGRLLFPALPALAILLAAGMHYTKALLLKRSALAAHGAGYVALVALLALAAWLPFGVIRPAYPLHTLPEAAALASIGTPTFGRFGRAEEPGAELRGWAMSGPARPGATLELTLMWRANARQSRDWTVFVHLVDRQEQVVAEDNRPPLDGAFPMTQWTAGDWVADGHALRLPADLAPGVYALRVGLYDPRGGDERADVRDHNGRLVGDFVELGQVLVNR